jgi:hypothetical protein
VGEVSEAGCTGVEHWFFATDAMLRILAKRGTYFDPNVGLVMQNYLDNRRRFLGVANYNEEEMGNMEKAIPTTLNTFQRSLKIQGLKTVFGTDAVAAAHGRNIEELVYRVEKTALKKDSRIAGDLRNHERQRAVWSGAYATPSKAVTAVVKKNLCK